MIPLRPSQECVFNLISLGEVMLRLDPGEGRIHTAQSIPCKPAAAATPATSATRRE